MRIVGVDFSLTSTGLACIDRGGIQVHRIQSKHTGDDLAARSLRMRSLTSQVFAHCLRADLVVIEGPAYASDTGKAHDRSGCWWMIVGRLTGTGILVAEVPPSTLKQYALGRGGGKETGKDNMLAETIHRYQHLVRVTGNDIADAVQLAALGYHHLTGTPLVELPQTHYKALAGVKWPPLNR